MSRLSQRVRQVARQGNVIQAVVVDTTGSRATVRLSTNGAVHQMLSVMGGPVVKGQTVRVNFGSSVPFIMSPLTGITDVVGSRTKPLAPIAHMNTQVTVTSGSTSGSAPPGVAYYNFMFAPALGGSLSSGDYTPKTRMLFGGGPYDSWGSSAWDYFGIGGGPVVGFPSDSVIPDSMAAFVLPRDFTTLKVTPIIRMPSGFTKPLYVIVESYSYAPNWSTGVYEVNNYWDDSYATGNYPYYTTGTALNGCIAALQAVYPNSWMDGPLGAGSLMVFYMYLSIPDTNDPQPFFNQGYLVEMTG